MIVLPESPAPNGAVPELIDFGMLLRPATGAATTRIDRAGSRFKVDFTFPPMKPDAARIFVSRLIAAKSEGLRIAFPLLGVSQGFPGVPVVNGSGASGTSLPLTGLTPGWVAKEGYWLTAIDADGVHYLHNIRAVVVTDGSGLATLTIAPALRAPLVNGDTVLLSEPLVEGFVTSVVSWELPANRLVTVAFTLEEAA